MVCRRAIILLREDSAARLVGFLASSAWYILSRRSPCFTRRSMVPKSSCSSRCTLDYTVSRGNSSSSLGVTQSQQHTDPRELVLRGIPRRCHNQYPATRPLCSQTCRVTFLHSSTFQLDKLTSLTMAVRKPSIVIEQATSSYSFRSPELSQPI